MLENNNREENKIQNKSMSELNESDIVNAMSSSSNSLIFKDSAKNKQFESEDEESLLNDEDDDYELQSTKDISQLLKIKIKAITQNFEKTYKETKKQISEDESIICEFESLEKSIIKYIQNERKKKKKKLKRTLNKRDLLKDSNLPNKRKYFNQSQIEYLLNNFQDLRKEQKQSLIKVMAAKLEEDGAFKNLVDQVTNSTIDKIEQYFEQGNEQEIQNTYEALPCHISILINLKIAQKNQTYKISLKTLRYSLLPYINQCPYYDFLNKQMIPTAKDIFIMLCNSLQEEEKKITSNFILFGFWVGYLQCIPFEKNKDILKEAWKKMKYQEEQIQQMITSPQKFLWPDLSCYLLLQVNDVRLELITILLKLDVNSDPGQIMNDITNILCSRPFLTQLLKNKIVIKLTPKQIHLILERLKDLPIEIIKSCLEQESSEWDKSSQQLQSRGGTGKENNNVDIQKFFQQYVNNENQSQILKEFEKLSKLAQQRSPIYKDDNFQYCIASILVCQPNNLTIAQIPTGSGKSFIIGLLAMYYQLINKCDVIVIVSNEILKKQLYEQIGPFCQGQLKIKTMNEIYQYKIVSSILIIDEFDDLISTYPYKIANKCINGIWNLKNLKTFGLTATLSEGQKNLVRDQMSEHNKDISYLEFPSSYTFFNNKVIDATTIEAYLTEEEILNKIIDYIQKEYNQIPFVCFVSEDQQTKLIEASLRYKWEYYIDASHEQLQILKTKSQGILLLRNNNYRGIDTKFKVDSKVLIGCYVKNIGMYLQMMGRSSRSRNTIKGIYLCQSIQSPNEIYQSLLQNDYYEQKQLSDLLSLFQEIREREIANIYKRTKDLTINAILSIENLAEYVGNELVTKIRQRTNI